MGDRELAREGARQAYAYYEEVEARFMAHAKSCKVWACEVCGRLNRAAEAAWDAVEAAEGCLR